MLNRRDFLTCGALGFFGLQAAAIGKIASVGSVSPEISGTPGNNRFFQNPTFEFMFLVSLGKCYQRAADLGKLLYIAGQIEDGNYESAYRAFYNAGAEAEELAGDSLAAGHEVSAREAFLWASNYYYSATYFIDLSDDPSRMLPTWRSSRDCFESAMTLFEPLVVPVMIPYEGTTLSGYYFRCERGSSRRPLIILNNGSDGSILDMWCAASGALARGYNCLTFDGPGQGASLWLQNLYFRPDWENVITPVVDFALHHLKAVDKKKIALMGMSQGGFWVPRAVAFEKRIVATIADPGAWTINQTWRDSISKVPGLLDLLDSGEKDKFNAEIDSWPDEYKIPMQARMRPYGISNYYDCYKAVEQYVLTDDVISAITCPILITNPENETFFPGQPQQLFDKISSAGRQIVDFTAETGANLHCEPKAAGLRDLKLLDWLDEKLRR